MPDRNADGVGGALSQRRECSAESLRPPEIVGEIENPVLEMVRRLWWRAFDRVSGCLVSFRLWLFDRIHRPEPPIPADLQRETNHDRLVKAFTVAGKTIEPTK
jgi:hypothetical protein